MLSTQTFWLGAVLVALLAITQPPITLLLLDLALVLVPGSWYIAGVQLDPTDLMLAGIAVSAWLHPGARRDAFLRSLPRAGLWASLLIISTVAFLVVPANTDLLVGPVATAFHVLKLCWKPLLYYPLAFYVIADRKRLAQAFTVVELVAVLCSIQAIDQGYSGAERVTGPFDSKNALGGALVMPFLIAFARAASARASRKRLLHVAAMLIVGRGLMFAGSRGAFVAITAGSALLLGILWARGERRRATRLVAAGALAFVVSLIVIPDLFDRPNVQVLLSATEGTSADSMRWRSEERWPHFLAIALQHPLVGVGTDVDYGLGEDTNTPHNGYLSLAVQSGFPFAVLLVSFVVGTLRRSARFAAARDDAEAASFGLAATAALTGLLIHNFVDAICFLPFANKTMWLLAAAVGVLERERRQAPAADEESLAT